MLKHILKKSLYILSVATLISHTASARAPLQASYIYQLENDGDESVSVSRIHIRAGAPLYRKNGSLLALGVRYSMDRYHFKNTTADWETVHHTEIGLGSRWKINDRWLWGNYASLGLSAEESAERSDAYRYSLISIAEYKVNDSLTIGPGFGISSEFELDPTIFPIIAVKWQINDEWLLSSGPSEITPTGANLYFRYKPKALNDQWEFTAGASYSSKNFRLASSTSAAKTSGEEKNFSLYLAATYRLENGIRISPLVGYQTSQTFSIFDHSGSEISKEKLDAAPFIGLNVGVEF